MQHVKGSFQVALHNGSSEPDSVPRRRAEFGQERSVRARENGRSTLELSRGATGVLPELHVGSFDDPASFVPRAAGPLNFVN